MTEERELTPMEAFNAKRGIMPRPLPLPRYEGRNTCPTGFEETRSDPKDSPAPHPLLPVIPDGAAAWPRPLHDAARIGLPGDFLRLFAAHTEADEAALLFQLLVAFGNLVGPAPHFEVECARQPLVEQTVLVGATSKARKGTSWGPVARVLALVDPEWAESRIQTGLSSGEGLIAAVRDRGSEGPLNASVVEDRRLLVKADEFASVLAVMDRSGNTLSPVVRDCWDGRNLQTMTRADPLIARKPHVSIIGHVTRDDLLAHLPKTAAADGFGNRILWVAVNRSKVLPEGGAPPTDAVGLLAERIRASVERARTLSTPMARDEDARALWARVYPDLSEGGTGVVAGMTARAEAHVMRLAALYALLDGHALIGTEHLEAALAAWRYAAESAAWIFGEASGDPVVDRLLTILRDAGNRGMSLTELHSAVGGHTRAATLQAALTRLETRGQAAMRRESSGGRPRQVWNAT